MFLETNKSLHNWGWKCSIGYNVQYLCNILFVICLYIYIIYQTEIISTICTICIKSTKTDDLQMLLKEKVDFFKRELNNAEIV